MRRRLAAFMLALAGLALMAPIAPPDTRLINDARVFGGVFQTGDMLFVARYNVAYTTEPAESIAVAYITTVYDATSTPIVTGTPIVFSGGGYGDGIFSLYLSPTDVATYGVAWNTSMGVAVSGNPTQFVSVPTTGIFGALDWVDQAISGTDLAGELVEMMLNLENTSTWTGTDFVRSSPSGPRLTDDGANYIDLAIPNIRTAAPNMYLARSVTLVVERRTISTSSAPQIGTQLTGSPIDVALTSLAGNWNVSADAMKLVTALIFASVLAGIAVVARTPVDWTFIVFLTGMTIAGIVGLLSVAILIVAVLFLILSTGWLVFKPSG